MTDTLNLEGSAMKSEGLILNVICVVFALLFIAVVVWTFISAGSLLNFLTIDNLFITTVFLLLALVFLVTPLMTLFESGKLPVPFLRAKANASASSSTSPAALKMTMPSVGAPGTIRSAASRPGLPPPRKTPRTIPPDVEKMVAQMREPEEKTL
jgi:hypothetical protein